MSCGVMVNLSEARWPKEIWTFNRSGDSVKPVAASVVVKRHIIRAWVVIFICFIPFKTGPRKPSVLSTLKLG